MKRLFVFLIFMKIEGAKKIFSIFCFFHWAVKVNEDELAGQDFDKSEGNIVMSDKKLQLFFDEANEWWEVLWVVLALFGME
jgi:hypothetical protein